MPSSRPCGVACLLGLLLAVPPAAAFELERLETPADGASVTNRLRFFISARGEWDRADRYKIELSDDGFETVLMTFDGSRDRKGWAIASIPGEEEVEGFEESRGVYYLLREPLPDGEYSWRAFKYEGTGFSRLSGEFTFRVDTVAPGPVGNVRLATRRDGRLELRWDPVFEDEEGNPETVTGYRVYRFLKSRAARNMPTYLVGETENTRFLLPQKYDHPDAVMQYFRVMAIDEVGNERNRVIPHPLGDLEPPDPSLVR
jgi:hypothetical protein